MRISTRTSIQGLVCLAFTLSAGMAMAQTKLRAWNIHPDTYPVSIAMKSFVEQVAAGTQGRYTIELFNNGALGDQPKAVQMLKAGEIDVAEFSAGPLSEAVPGIKVLNLPFLFTDSGHMFTFLDGKLGERYAANLKAAGFVVLGWYNGGARSFYCVKPVAALRDLTGRKIRLQQSEVYTTMAQLIEATSVAMPFKEVLEGFQQGKIDCAENNMPSYESTGHYKEAKYVFLTNHVISPEALVVSTKLWDKLSKEDKVVFAEAGAKSATFMRELWEKRVASATEITTKQGSTFVKVRDVSPMIRRMGPLYQKYLHDPTTRDELLTIIAK